MRARLTIASHFQCGGSKTRRHLYASILGGAILLLPVAPFAQTPQAPAPKPTPAIQKLLDDATTIKDAAQRIDALKKTLDAAKSANDIEGKGEAESALGLASDPPNAIPWFEAALADFKATLDLPQQSATLVNLGQRLYVLRQIDKSLDCFIELVEVNKKVGKPGPVGVTLAHIATMYREIGQNEKAIDYDNQALPFLKTAGDLKSVGRTTSDIGIAYESLGQHQKALDTYNRALVLEKQAGDKVMMGGTLSNIGVIYGLLGQPQKTLDYYIRALSFLKEGGADKGYIGAVLANIGILYDGLGQSRKALDYYNQAVPIFGEVKNMDWLGRTLISIGSSYEKFGESQKALEYLNRALEALKGLGDRHSEALALGGIGSVYNDLWQRQKALDYFDQVAAIFKDQGDRQSEGRTLGNIGYVYNDLGQTRKGLDYFNQALTIFKELGDKESEAIGLIDLGNSYDALGQRQKSLGYYNQALTLAKDVGDRRTEGGVLASIGGVYLELGQPQKAMGVARQAFHIMEEAGDRMTAGKILGEIGNSYRDLGHHAKALDYYNRSLALSRAVGDRGSAAETLSNASRCLWAEKLHALAVLFAKQSVNAFQDLRKDIGKLPKTDQEAYAKKIEPTYRRLADLLIKQGRLREAEKVMNLLKGEENFEFVDRDAAATKGVEGRIEAVGAEEGWWTKYQALADKALKIDSDEYDLTQQTSKLRARATPTASQKAEIANLEAKLRILDAQKEVIDNAADAYFVEVGKQASQLGDAIRKEAEERVRQTGDELPSLLQRIHRDSNEKVGAVYALASTDELDFLIVTYAGRAHLSVPVKSDDLNAMISQFRKVLMNPFADPKPEGEKLYHLVFETLIRQLREAGCSRVVWCLDGTLRYVPIGALWDGKEYLIERGDFTMFDPLNLDRISAEASKSLLAAGFAATEGKAPDFAPLPGADKELKSVVKDDSQPGYMGAIPGRGFENKAFDEPNLTAAMKGEQFSLLHIATHLNVGKDFNTSQLLLGDGNLLSLKQFTDAGSHGRLGHLDLVCLSACDSAESFGDSGGTGSQFSSFVSLTLKDGANSVVASLWPVSDASTPILMQRFYANWMANKDKGKAEALRQAQLSLLHGDPKFNHPYYWAPFILFGNWK